MNIQLTNQKRNIYIIYTIENTLNNINPYILLLLFYSKTNTDMFLRLIIIYFAFCIYGLHNSVYSWYYSHRIFIFTCIFESEISKYHYIKFFRKFEPNRGNSAFRDKIKSLIGIRGFLGIAKIRIWPRYYILF